jgi:hypothetical protein
MAKPEFATNRPDKDQHVYNALLGFLAELRTQRPEPRPLDIATAYVNPGGFGLLADELEELPSARLVIGADPDAPLARVRALADETSPEERALEGHLQSMEEDRNLLGFTVSEDKSAKRFVDWLRSGKVECRRYTEGFLHGKAFLVRDHDEGVIAGSANFTYAGLAKNLELDLGHYHPSVVREVADWFDHVWDNAEDFDLAAVYEARYQPHPPHLIYLRMLWEKYGADVEALAAADPYGLHLAPFQADGVTLARMILTRHSGVVVADGVGLGKTFIAGELIRETVEERRQKVLVVAPAALRDGPWASFKANQLFNFDLVSYDELSMDTQLNPDHPYAKPVLLRDVDEYAMVVVDEAHAYRNAATQRSGVLSRLLEGSPPKALVLMTATPVNNSLWDLYNLLAYFVRNDAAFATAGIPSLREKFTAASLTDPDALDPDHLYDVLSPVVVRRTRSYVKHYYPDAEIQIRGVKQRIQFPTSEVRAVNYDLATVLPGFLDRFAAAVDVPDDDGDGNAVVRSASERRAAGEDALTLARYAPSAYRLDGETEAYEGQVAGLLRSGLLKRFESSSCAFASTCVTMAESHDRFLELLDEGWIATGAALRELAVSDSDDLDDLVEARGDEWNANPASEYALARLRADVEADRDLLRAWAVEARTVTRGTDPKLAALADELAVILQGAIDDVGETSTEGDRRKVLIFSYFADTVDWLRGFLEAAVASDPRLAPYADRVVAVAGSDRETDQRKALFGFAPITTEAPPGTEDAYDLLVSTDVLAEGVNAQQARHIISYDLPWNPQRLVQRHGRIDRIGSPHSKVWMRCFMPDKQLDKLLGLEDRLHRKIKQAARSIGTESTIIPGSEVSDRTYTETREAIENIRSGDAGFLDDTGASGMTVEEYRQQLREAMENPFLKRQIEQLAWGSGSGKAVRGAQPGFVFCARVGDNPDPHYRYVSLADAENPVVVPDVLACLKYAYATEHTERILDDATYEAAYGSWAVAKASIYEQWMWSTDLRNLQPEIPKAMRDAAEVVRLHPPAGHDQAQVDRLYDTLNAPYAERVRRQVRAALAQGTAAEQVAELVDIVTRLALSPPPEPTPLPLIDEDDVHLICWMAIVPAEI